MNTKCVCLICFTPNEIWFDFLSKFTKYDIYIMIDDNSKDYKEEYSNFRNIHVIQIKNEDCKNNGFVDMNFTIRKNITSWEKAIYYFSTINTEYNYVWFFEDDVFFYHEQSLINIDSKYDNSDLLSKSYSENISGDKKNWLWNTINIKFSPPYYNAMVCIVRISSQMLYKIRNYANEHKTLFFLEALFPTICKKYNLQYDTPCQFKNIIYRKDYTDKDMDENNLFHPIKDINKHTYYREMLYKMSNKSKDNNKYKIIQNNTK